MKTPIFGYKDNRLEYQSRESCYAVIFDAKKQQVATIKTAAKGYFLPGGGVEDGETLEECLIRELLEETGYQVKINSSIGKAQRYFVTSQNEPILNIGNFFIANFITKVREPIDEDHKLKWISLDETDYFFHEHHAWAVKKAINLLKRR